MTLDTRMVTLDHVDVHALFAFGQMLMTKYDDPIHRPPSDQKMYDKARETWRDGSWSVRPDSPWAIGNELGQGLPAIFDIEYRPGEGGMLRTAEQAAAHDDDCTLPGCEWWIEGESEACDGTYHRQACWAEISFDTAYGYKGPNGWGCGDLHAALVSQIGLWLDERNVRWRWQNEFTGEWHNGAQNLADLGRGGADASSWFEGAVKPAIASHIVTEMVEETARISGPAKSVERLAKQFLAEQ